MWRKTGKGGKCEISDDIKFHSKMKNTISSDFHHVRDVYTCLSTDNLMITRFIID